MIPYQLLISQLSHEGGELQSGRGTFQGMYPRWGFKGNRKTWKHLVSGIRQPSHLNSELSLQF